MNLIIDLTILELSELFALEFAKIAESDFVYTLASTNLQTWPLYIYAHKVSDKFDYGSNPIVISGVICP